MISSIDDFLVILLVGLLLFAGDKTSASNIKSIMNAFNEFKKRRDEFINELKRELNEVTSSNNEIIRDVSSTFNQGLNEAKNTLVSSVNEIKLLEERIRELEDEIERLKRQNGNKP
ncbi:MAG: hypothetical protein RXR43_04025 [Sulfolobus sp.]